MSEPTLILRNARAITFDPARPRASAVALPATASSPSAGRR